MHEIDIARIADEIASVLVGRRFGSVFQFRRDTFAIDFHPHAGFYLFVDINGHYRRVLLIRRKLKDLERTSTSPSPFALQLRDLLSHAILVSVGTFDGSRTFILKFSSEAVGPLDLVVQLGGRHPNILVLNPESTILAAARVSENSENVVGKQYIPAPDDDSNKSLPTKLPAGQMLSDVLDSEMQKEYASAEFEREASQARRKLRSEITKRSRLLQNIREDIENKGDPDTWKRYGDLLLANASTARREGGSLIAVDYFDPTAAEIKIPVEKEMSATQAAEFYFDRYTKARNGLSFSKDRIVEINAEIRTLEGRLVDLESVIERGDSIALAEYLPQIKKPSKTTARKQKPKPQFKGARRFVSSDDLEILVGKRAADNDHLTFRIAGSLDLWLHAADYPGSHVVIRNPGRKDIPDRTLLEAAQLAAFYSDARGQGKAAVNYTQKKYVNKPKRSAPGLVSLASFRTILVEPKVAVPPAGDEARNQRR